MKLKDLLQKRYSMRTYLPREVEKEKLDYIIECARLAPSACNFQPWVFYVLTSDEARQAVLEAYPREWMKPAPVYIVVCADYSQSWKRPKDAKDFGDVDAAIAAEHICLSAAELGLGTCWVCNFDTDVLTRFLSLTENVAPIAIFPIGYVDEEKNKVPEKKRKPVSEITKWL